jgi:hypothetical protein
VSKQVSTAASCRAPGQLYYAIFITRNGSSVPLYLSRLSISWRRANSEQELRIAFVPESAGAGGRPIDLAEQ